MKKLLLYFKALAFMACLLSALTISAYDFYKDGIYYNITSSTTVEVTGNFVAGADCETIYSTDYSGYVNIPPRVTYNGVTYKVDEIGSHAFKKSDVSYLVIPSTITYINGHAFEGSGFAEIVCFASSDVMSYTGWGPYNPTPTGHTDILYVPQDAVAGFRQNKRW